MMTCGDADKISGGSTNQVKFKQKGHYLGASSLKGKQHSTVSYGVALLRSWWVLLLKTEHGTVGGKYLSWLLSHHFLELVVCT